MTRVATGTWRPTEGASLAGTAVTNSVVFVIGKVAAKMNDEDWHKVLDVNLSGAFFIAQAALDHMMERLMPTSPRWGGRKIPRGYVM
ncbi:MAG: SDR family NAD(P)-dependent oxidoreductase [Streptosporangiaceae bacterium]